jgi:hypothetical protein
MAMEHSVCEIIMYTRVRKLCMIFLAMFIGGSTRKLSCSTHLKLPCSSDIRVEMTSSSTLHNGTTATLPPGITFPPTHAPIPTANIPALPFEFLDIPPSALSCWDAHANFTSSYRFLLEQVQDAMTYSDSTYPPGYEFEKTTYTNSYYNCSTSAVPTLTTLCDGYPRASTISSQCLTTTETYSWSHEATAYFFYPTWSTELDQLQTPTCTPASDFGPVCTRLKDAYSWRVTNLQSQVPAPTGSILGPGCSVLNPRAPSAPPKCYLEGGSWEASYWPTPLPTGSEFCGTNGTNITATPTISAQPNTAVVSDITLISPSVYHSVRDATLQTLVGRASLIGDPESLGSDSFAPSTTASSLTVKQLPSDILTLSRGCNGSGPRRYCYYRASAGYFSVADLVTVRADEYCRPYGCYEDETILQNQYMPTVALAMTDVVTQNGVFTDCVWTTPGARIRTVGPAAWRGPRMKQSDWHEISATVKGVKETGMPKDTPRIFD